jgi:hypothetical protein
MENDRLIRAEHGAGGDPDQERIADLAGGPSNRNSDGRFHRRRDFYRWQEMAEFESLLAARD